MEKIKKDGNVRPIIREVKREKERDRDREREKERERGYMKHLYTFIYIHICTYDISHHIFDAGIVCCI